MYPSHLGIGMAPQNKSLAAGQLHDMPVFIMIPRAAHFLMDSVSNSSVSSLGKGHTVSDLLKQCLEVSCE